jgi:hypothetical protein
MVKHFIALLCFLATLIFAGPSLADWQCTSSNARGMTWSGYGIDRFTAKTNALRKCAPYSRYCGIVACAGNSVVMAAPVVVMPTGGSYACTVFGRAGGHWTGVGPSRSMAIANAVQLCRRNGNPPCVFYPGNCHIQ